MMTTVNRDNHGQRSVDIASIIESKQETEDEHFDGGEQISNAMPAPPCSAYMDRIVYRSVHFYGSRLGDPLNDAALYLIDMEQANGEPPFVLAIQHSYSREDGESPLAWQVTLVVGLLDRVPARS